MGLSSWTTNAAIKKTLLQKPEDGDYTHWNILQKIKIKISNKKVFLISIKTSIKVKETGWSLKRPFNKKKQTLKQINLNNLVQN